MVIERIQGNQVSVCLAQSLAHMTSPIDVNPCRSSSSHSEILTQKRPYKGAIASLFIPQISAFFLCQTEGMRVKL